MAYALTLGTVAFLLAVIWGNPLLALLRKYSIGKQIRIDGPSSHQVKMGTPTMGGTDDYRAGGAHHGSAEHRQSVRSNADRAVHPSAHHRDAGVWGIGICG